MRGRKEGTTEARRGRGEREKGGRGENGKGMDDG